MRVLITVSNYIASFLGALNKCLLKLGCSAAEASLEGSQLQSNILLRDKNNYSGYKTTIGGRPLLAVIGLGKAIHREREQVGYVERKEH